MKKTGAMFLILFVVSCQWFDSPVPDKDKLLKERLNEIDFNNVSSYPSLPECNSLSSKALKKECFITAMAQLIQQKLDADTIAILYPEIDTIRVQVTVHPDATLSFESQFTDDNIPVYNRTKIDSILKSKLVNFPDVEPAQKEGIPVTTTFILPVILDVKP